MPRGPYSIDSFGDYFYIVGSDGVRIAECDEQWKADRVCAALNAAHHFSVAAGVMNA